MDERTKKDKIKEGIIKMNQSILSILMITFTFLFLTKMLAKPSQEIKQKTIVSTKTYLERNVYIVKPKKQPKNSKLVFYLHGGAYIGDLTKEHWDFIQDLVLDTGYTFIVPDYPLAPQYQYIDVFAFIKPLYEEILKQVEEKDIVIMGDSAGGGMSLALVQKLGEEGKSQPDKLILLSPWLDLSLENPEIKEIEPMDPTLSVWNLKMAAMAYAGKEQDNYLASPIYGPVENLPEVVILTGTYDILNPDVHRFVKMAEKEKKEIKVKETKKAQHIWMLKRHIPGVYAAEEGYQQVLEELRGKRYE